MIRYTLKCDNDHRFDSWFQSANAFDKLSNAGLVACAVCGSSRVKKAIMAPPVRPARTRKSASTGARNEPETDAENTAQAVQKPASPLSAPASPAEQAVAELRARIEATSEDVGPEFAREARAIHAGDAPARPIIGQAKPAEAQSLIEDGVPVAPLPWGNRKTD